MKRISFATAILAVALFGSLNAQTAKIDAMGGCGVVVRDATWVIGFPAYLLEFPDIIQATYDGSVGPIVAIKELNSSMSAGFYYSQNRVLQAAAYTFLVNNLVAAITNTAPTLAETDVDPIPHLLFGMELGSAKLGFDVWFERAFYTYSLKQITTGAETTTKVKGRFMNPGILASLHLEALRIALGASVPISRQSFTNETAAGTVEETVKSKGSIAAELGGELDMDLFDLPWTFGLSIDMVMFSGKRDLKPVAGASTTNTYASYLYLAPTIYGGTINDVGNGISLPVQGSAGYVIDRMKPDQASTAPGGRTTRDDVVLLSLNCGIEKIWDNLNRLDEIQTRAGLTYSASIDVAREDGKAGGDEYHSRMRSATARGFDLPLGVGILKDIFSFEVQMNPGVLINTFKLVNGLFNPAPQPSDFAKATLTVDFGGGRNSGGASSSSSSSLPSIESTREPAATPTPATDFEF